MHRISSSTMKRLLMTVTLFIITSLVVGRALADDHGDTAATATPIGTDGTSVAGVIEPFDDEDWFSFSAESGFGYRIALGGSPSTFTRLYDIDGVTVLDVGGDAPSLIHWMCLTSGTYYVEVDSHLFEVGSYTLSVEPFSDDHGDTATTATPIGTDGTSVAGVIEVGDDEDWFSFSAIAGNGYRIATGDSLDTVIYLYGSDGVTQLDSDDDGGTGYSSLIHWTCLTSGTYYVKVESYSTNEGSYTLSIEALPDDHGDTAATATPIGTNGTSVAGVIDVGDDEDWFSFDAIAGIEYWIATDGSLNTVIYLYGSDGVTQLDSDDDGGSGHSSLIEWTCLTSGTHYVKVESYSTDTGSYALSVGPLHDDHGNTAATATSIGTDGTSVAGVIEVGDDEDWFSFSAMAGNEYWIATGDSLDTVIYLYASDGVTQLDSDDDGGSGHSSLIEWTCLTSGTHYVKVESYSTDTGSYALSVWPLPDDHGNTAATATSIGTDGRKVAGVIAPFEDEDWFSFSAMAGNEYQIATGDSLDTVIYLYASDGVTVLDSDDDGGTGYSSLIEWTCLTSGTHYVKVESYDWEYTGSYTLLVEDQSGSPNPMAWLMLLLK